jgi:hypothetical protein
MFNFSQHFLLGNGEWGMGKGSMASTPVLFPGPFRYARPPINEVGRDGEKTPPVKKEAFF